MELITQLLRWLKQIRFYLRLSIHPSAWKNSALTRWISQNFILGISNKIFRIG